MSFEFRTGQELRKKGFRQSFLSTGEEDKWNGTHNYKAEGKWNMTADVMVEHFKESGHPLFYGTSASNRGFLKRKGGRCAIHFNAESSHAELFFRTIHSANQLSTYGAVGSWCEEMAQQIPGQNEFIMEKVRSKGERTATQKAGAATSDFFGTNSKEE